jgi:hypothetical protein
MEVHCTHNSRESPVASLNVVCNMWAPAGDIDDNYLARLESRGRGANRTRAGKATALIPSVVGNGNGNGSVLPPPGVKTPVAA